MNTFFIKTLNWFISLNTTVLSVFKLMVWSRSSKLYKKNRTNQKRLIILGNGPSFKNTLESNFDFIKKQELICLNHFAITEYYTQLKPRYYFTIAHDLFLDNTKQEYKNASIRLFNTIADNTDWPLKFFITYEARKEKRWQEILKKNKNVEIVYMNVTPVEGFKWFRYYCYNHGLGMTRPHNIMIPSIHFAIFSNVKEILLIGSEHSWIKEIHVDENNNVLFFNEHFYDKEKQYKEYNNRGQSAFKLHEVLATIAAAFKSYQELNEYAQSRNISIYNCTKGSFIDAFERKQIEEFV
ncbi:MAG: hypothetical protein PHW82_08690 [Bacteroidales bacterium]|nr:hypothetical protein [Bacteroidales bacterium]